MPGGPRPSRSSWSTRTSSRTDPRWRSPPRSRRPCSTRSDSAGSSYAWASSPWCSRCSTDRVVLDPRIHRRPDPGHDRAARGRDEAALRSDAGGPVAGPERPSRGNAVIAALGSLVAAFEPPTTKDFVWGCWGPSLRGWPRVLPQLHHVPRLAWVPAHAVVLLLRAAEAAGGTGEAPEPRRVGVSFVNENIATPMLGPDGARFMPLLVTFFFAIFFWNIFEVVPGINFSSNSRIAFPLVMAIVAWVTYNAVGISKHGFLGYLRHVCFPPGAPAPVHPARADRVHHPDRRPADHPVRPTLGQLPRRPLPARRVLPGNDRDASGGFGDLRPVLVRHRGGARGLRDLRIGLQAFIFAILTASYIGGALAEEH